MQTFSLYGDWRLFLFTENLLYGNSSLWRLFLFMGTGEFSSQKPRPTVAQKPTYQILAHQQGMTPNWWSISPSLWRRVCAYAGHDWKRHLIWQRCHGPAMFARHGLRSKAPCTQRSEDIGPAWLPCCCWHSASRYIHYQMFLDQWVCPLSQGLTSSDPPTHLPPQGRMAL